MNSLKRPAPEPLLPLHSAKQRRTRMVGYDGGNPSPSEDMGLLSRWKSFGREFTILAFETIRTVYGIREDSMQYDRSTPPQAEQIQTTRSDNTRQDDQHQPLQDQNFAQGTSPQMNGTPTHKQSHTEPRCYRQMPSPRLARKYPHGGSLETSPTNLDSIRSPSSTPLYLNKADLSLKSNTNNDIPPRKYKNREHIYHKAHKANVRAEVLKSKEEMQRKIFALKRSKGYTSNFTDFQSLLAFQAQLEKLDQHDALSPSSSMIDLHAKVKDVQPRRHSYSNNDDAEFLRRVFNQAKATLNEPRPAPPFQPSLDQLRLSNRLKDDHIEQLLRPKLPPPTPLNAKEDAQVEILLKKRGVISKYAREQVNDSDISRLRPGQWLNDEIINFYGALILGRSDDCKENPPKQMANGTQLVDVHYFSTFFWPKLREGYEKGRLAKWTKKIDIFSKDVILIPVNHSNAHWTSAAIDFRRKLILSYDSMGNRRENVFKALRAYLDAEHRSKKGKPFDFKGWEDGSIEEPQQENGYDCGVFTCQYLQGLSRGDNFVRFTQSDMPKLRRRMIWEIGNGQLRVDP